MQFCKLFFVDVANRIRYRAGMSVANTKRVMSTRLASTILALTDLSAASYRLVSLATVLAGDPPGRVILVSILGGESGRSMARLRQEARLLTRQRQWCADRGIPCEAIIHDEKPWSTVVAQTARAFEVDLILLSVRFARRYARSERAELRQFAAEAPCPLSMVELPDLEVEGSLRA